MKFGSLGARVSLPAVPGTGAAPADPAYTIVKQWSHFTEYVWEPRLAPL